MCTLRIYPSTKLFNFLCADDGSSPNFDKLWEENKGHPEKITCKQSGGYACVKWTNYFDSKGKDFSNNLFFSHNFQLTLT
jgi:hypothetical protein